MAEEAPAHVPTKEGVFDTFVNEVSGGQGSQVSTNTQLNAESENAESKLAESPVQVTRPAAQPDAFGSPNLASPIDHAAKQLDFDAGLKPSAPAPASPETPQMLTGTKPGVIPVSTAAAGGHHGLPKPNIPAVLGEEDVLDYNLFIKDTLLWRYKVRSALYLLGGVGLIFMVQRALSSSTTFVTGACWLILAQMCLNFIRNFISPSLQERCTWYDSAWTHASIAYFSSALKGIAAVHDAHLQGHSATKTLFIGAFLWALSLLGHRVSATNLVLACWIGAFFVPMIYVSNKKQIDGVASQVYNQVQTHFVKLDPRLKALIIVIPILGSGYALSRTDLAIAAFLMLVYGRMWLKPVHVDMINEKIVTPLGKTTGYVGSHVATYASAAATKYELTPTPMKKKRS